MVTCQYCGVDGEYQLIEGEHKHLCPKFPLPCPNKCDVGSVPRQDITEHRKMCPLEEVECSNECGKILQRKYLKLSFGDQVSTSYSQLPVLSTYRRTPVY